MKRAPAVLLAGILLAASFAATAVAEGKGKALFEEKCILCHPLGRALSQSKDKDGWAKTVARMRERNGCRLEDAEAEAIVDYLAKVRGPEAK
ncbi:MAG: hypothetical protein Kow00128_15710 [Deltaproteobacteria bacterium]